MTMYKVVSTSSRNVWQPAAQVCEYGLVTMVISMYVCMYVYMVWIL